MSYLQTCASVLMTNLVAVLITFACSAATFAQCEVAQLMSGDAEDGNDFARSVALDGDIAVVGDPVNEVAYVFRRSKGKPGDWTLEQVLAAPDPRPDEQFGRVAIQGDVIVVGAYNTAAPEFHQGAAYIYRYDLATNQWRFAQQLVASDGGFGDLFGWSLAIDCDTVLVGARDDDVKDVNQAGSAYVFRYDDQLEQWIEEAKLTHPNADSLDLFGQAVAVSGDVAIVGVPGVNGRIFVNAGAAFAFRRDSNKPRQWNFQQKLTASDPSPSAWFGWSLCLADGVALIGAPFADGQDGAAYVFTYDPDTSEWIEQIKLFGSDPIGVTPSFGYSVALSVDTRTALIGAQGDNAQGFDAGAVYLFRNEDSGWTEIEKLLASDGSSTDILGTSVSISGSTGLLGAPRQSEFSGTAYVFELDPPLGDLDCNGQVSVNDLLALLADWGPCSKCKDSGDCPADLDGDCVVGLADLLILLSNWG